MGKEILDIVREPVFKISDISDITYRQINDWESKGLINPQRVGSNKGWRSFSIVDLLTLKIIRDFKKHSFPDVYIEQIINYVLAGLEVLQLSVVSCNEDKYYLLVCDNNKMTLVMGKQSIIDVFEECNEKHKPALIVPIGNYLHDAIIKYYKKALLINNDSDINPLINAPLNIKEEIISDIIKDGNYEEILIKRQDQDYIIRGKKTESNKLSRKEIINLFDAKDYQDIVVKTRNKTIINITREEFIKL